MLVLAEIEEDLLEYPNLHLVPCASDSAEIRGTFPVRSPAGKELDRYLVNIKLLADFSDSLPVVREVGQRIPQIEARHVNSDGTACVLLPDDRWRHFPNGARFAEYLRGPLHDFFLSQSLVERGEPWPYGAWGHGINGVREYYSWLLGTDESTTISGFLHVLARREMKRHWDCPCGSGRIIKKCCDDKLRDLRLKIPHEVAAKAINTLGLGSGHGP